MFQFSINMILFDIMLKQKYENGKWKIRKKRTTKDNSKKGDIFLNCRCCKSIITNDYRSKFDTRYCVDCL